MLANNDILRSGDPMSPDHDKTESHADALTRMMPVLLRRARRLSASSADAEDLAQEALLRVWARLRIAEDIEEIDGYLMVTMRHLSRRRSRNLQFLENTTAETQDANVETRVFAAQVLSEVARLPRDEADMISAIAVQGISYADYANARGLPVGTVMSRLSRSRRRLRERLDLGHTSVASLDIARSQV